MARQVALLRGVNLGGRNRVPMADLRLLFESLGATDVATFIQSGNVVFSSAAPVGAVELAAAVGERFGITTDVVLRDQIELEQVLLDNPFAGVEPDRLHVAFLARRPDPAVWRDLDGAAFQPDQFAPHGGEVYLHLPDGMARTKLPAYLGRRLRIPMTVRNWATVTKLSQLASDQPA